MTYTLGGADATSFAIEAASGQLMTTAASEALAEGSTYDVRVTVSDGKAAPTSVDVTITVGAAGSGTLLERYDTNSDGIIDINEALVAIADHFANNLDLPGSPGGRCPLLCRAEQLDRIARQGNLG